MGVIAFNTDLDGAPDVYRAGTEAFGLWVLSVSYICRNGGDVYPTEQAVRGDSRGRLAPLLIGAGFWEWCEDGYRVLNPTMRRSGKPAYRYIVPAGKVPGAVRREVYARDGLVCQECGATEDLTLDHIWPKARGGKHTAQNLRVLCRSCNSSKGARV